MSLPSNTFLFNYNAKQYDVATYTFPKTEGQLYDEDLVLISNPGSADTENGTVYFDGTTYGNYYHYNVSSENPFNRNSDDSTFTFIYKTLDYADSSTNLFANRGNDYNYMVRGLYFHSGIGGILTQSIEVSPQIVVVRVQADGSGEMLQYDVNGNLQTTTTTSNISWGGPSDMICFFGSSWGDTTIWEMFSGTFYWMYCSNEALTDAEIQEVIDYNNNPSSNVFKIDKENIEFKYTGGTDTITVRSTNPFTASTQNEWLTINTTTTETGGVVTVTTGLNTGGPRVGTVSFTNGEDILTCAIKQGMNNTFSFKNIYRNGRRIN